MSPPQQLRQQTSNCRLLLIYRPRKDERLSWPSWLTYSEWFIHISGHPSATGQAQDSESTPAKDRCSTAGPRNQLMIGTPVLHSSLFYQTPNPMLYNAFKSATHPKCPLPWGRLDLHVTLFPGRTQLSIPNCISIGSAVFPQLIVERSYTLQCALKRNKRATKKLTVLQP